MLGAGREGWGARAGRGSGAARGGRCATGDDWALAPGSLPLSCPILCPAPAADSNPLLAPPSPLQAAAHLANMGLASMLLGSPPPAGPAMMHGSPVGHLAASPFMAPQVIPSPGPMLAPQPDFGMGLGMMHGVQQAAAAAAMMQQAGGYDGSFGLGSGDMASLPMPIPIPMHTPPPRFAGSRLGLGGFGSPPPRHSSGGYRGTPGNRMSRFGQEHQGAVAAF